MKNFLQWNFDGESETFRLVTEALAIKFAHMITPCLAVHTSPIEPLPHQISAVYEKMLPRHPLRFLLADDPGAGKTIMTGLLIKEKFFRGELHSCLIVCPAALVEQWQDELRQKFRLRFKILTDDNFHTGKFFVAAIDKLVRNENLREKISAVTWDLVVCDEAHKMSATVQGNEVHYTKRFHLGQLLGKISRNFLLLTATPHNGKPKDFYQFMSLLDAERFLHAQRINCNVDTSDLMRRLVKEDLLTFDGKPLFPERRAYTVNYTLSTQEKNLYELVTAYVADGFNRAEKLHGNKKFSVGFAMTILQRRLASSPLAIFKSLTRRTQRLQEILHAKKFSSANVNEDILNDYDEFSDAEIEQLEDDLSARMTAAENLDELQQEIDTLEHLSATAEKVLHGGVDRKWLELSALLDGKNFPRTEKLIIFTEHRDTLDYLHEKISARLGEESVAVIHGGLSHKVRRDVQDDFRHDEKISVLIATDAAGEGINLQVAHLMINYDLPWNPNRLEQRFGRIHRIGQKNICRVWNLVADDTREGKVFARLLEKLSAEKSALGGKVFDVLGKISFDNKPLRELLTAAIRDGDNPATIRRLNKIVDKTFDAQKLRKLFDDNALAKDTINLDAVKKIRRDGADYFQPPFVENFFVDAFNKLGGRMFWLGRGRYEIVQMPVDVSNKTLQDERISFTDEIAGAELINIGHPLLSEVADLTLKKFGDVLKRGAIFVDDTAVAENLRLLFFVTTKIVDGRNVTLSEKLHAFEVSTDGKNFSPNATLNYRSATAVECEQILSKLKSARLENVEALALTCAEKFFVTSQLQAVTAERIPLLDKSEAAISLRRQREVSQLDADAAELSATDKLNAKKISRQADELDERFKQRLAEIKRERKISAETKLLAAALIVPRVCLADEKNSDDADSRARVEELAMQAVMKIERELGNMPADVSNENRGYDVESVTPDGRRRLIEVKSRRADADTVTVTRHEILTALNSPDEFILAVVAVAENLAVTYLQQPFAMPPDNAAVSVNFRISALMRQGNITLTRIISAR